MKAKWIVDIKGSANSESFEISVIREDNEHGKDSYGWHDENKLYISGSGGPCQDCLTEKVWGKMVILAQEVADEMNMEES